MLRAEDPSLVNNSSQIIHYIKQHSIIAYQGFSIDIEDLYYSIPHHALLSVTEKATFDSGVVAFHNECGITVTGFPDALNIHDNSTFAEWNGQVFLQKSGSVRVGYSIAPVLSDLFLAHFDRKFEVHLAITSVAKCFRFVDDYRILFNCSDASFESSLQQT